MDEPGSVEQVLRETAPHELVDAARALAVTRHGARTLDLLMADYAMTRLQRVGPRPATDEPLTVNGSAPGRAFGAQEPHLVEAGEETTVHLPVSVRGDRVGVLSVTLPAQRTADGSGAVEGLLRIADALAHEIVVADRVTDLFLQARRAERLTLAAELQWQLLPGTSLTRPEFDIGGQLEPAYAIYGDSFDWSAAAEHLTLTVNNGMGDGIDAALLTNLAVNALRNARRAELDLATQAALADQAVYGHYHGAQYLAMLLLRFHLATGEVELIDAGSPRMWRLRGSAVEQVRLEAQLPLGMAEDSVYVPQRLRLEPGDRLFFFTDGVYDVPSPEGRPFGEHALAKGMLDTRLLPASQVPRALLEELSGYRGAGQVADDAMVLCLDWRGR